MVLAKGSICCSIDRAGIIVIFPVVADRCNSGNPNLGVDSDTL